MTDNKGKTSLISRRKRNSPKSSHYVDNEKFVTDLIEYRQQYYKWKEDGGDKQTKPVLSNYAAKSFIAIANRVANTPGFANYSFKDEMITDAILNCIQYAHDFNPEKTKNGFAYFTQIVCFAFIRRIKKEKKLQQVKEKMLDNFITELSLQNQLHEYPDITSTQKMKKND